MEDVTQHMYMSAADRDVREAQFGLDLVFLQRRSLFLSQVQPGIGQGHTPLNLFLLTDIDVQFNLWELSHLFQVDISYGTEQ